MGQQWHSERLSEGLPSWSWWYLASLAAVLLGPGYLVLHQQLWSFPRLVTQSLVIALFYSALALLVRVFAERPQRRPLIVLGGVATAAVVAASVILNRLNWVASAKVFLAGGLLAVIFAVLPLALAPKSRTALAAFTTVGVAVLAALPPERREDTLVLAELAESQNTLYHRILITVQEDLVPPIVTQGGALTRLGDGFLLVTGVGEFYRLKWGADRDRLTAERLALSPASFNRQEMIDAEGPEPVTHFRITDVIIDDRSDPADLYIAHHHYDAETRCVSMRVSRTSLAGALEGGESSAWDVVFESEPCLRVGGEWRLGPDSNLDESGGRLGLHPDGGLLLTLGDHASDGLVRTEGPTRPFAQEQGVAYGKIWLLDGKGGARVYSMGHRNPQGLLVDQQGRIWSTEHGPQGGDELNLIVDGGNYGWPLVTYGVDYAVPVWPLAVDSRTHAGYREPAYVFVPSVGISQVIELGGSEFPRWSGDLMIASLQAQSLFRVRLNADGPIYAEPIAVGARIRDLEQSLDGRIVLWTDDGQIATLRRAELAESSMEEIGKMVYETRCSRCHDAPEGSNAALGPPLYGVVGRKVAAAEDYPYSEALEELGGTWTEELLDRFLQDPTELAPGTRMDVSIPIRRQRQALIQYLASAN